MPFLQHKNLIRSIGAIIFAGYFLYKSIEHMLSGNANSILINPTFELIFFSIIGWTLMLIIPVLSSFLMLYNKRVGIVTVRRYSIFFIVLLVPVVLMPDYVASVPMTQKEMYDSRIQAFIDMIMMAFVLFSTFYGKNKHDNDKVNQS